LAGRPGRLFPFAHLRDADYRQWHAGNMTAPEALKKIKPLILILRAPFLEPHDVFVIGIAPGS
jgi:hypothetical protein